MSKINSKEKELNEKNNEIQKLKKEQNSDSSLDISSNSEFSIHNRMRRYIESNVFKKINPASAIRSRKYFLNKFNSLIPNLNRKFIYDMKNSNYIDENGLTDLGFHFIWQLQELNSRILNFF